MTYEYSLSKLFPQGQSFRVMVSDKGKIKSKLVKFDFDKTYRTNDDVLIESLSKLSGRYPKNEANKTHLENIGVDFIEVPCRSCGGRIMKYEVKYFDIVKVD